MSSSYRHIVVSRRPTRNIITPLIFPGFLFLFAIYLSGRNKKAERKSGGNHMISCGSLRLSFLILWAKDDVFLLSYFLCQFVSENMAVRRKCPEEKDRAAKRQRQRKDRDPRNIKGDISLFIWSPIFIGSSFPCLCVTVI